MRSIIREIKSSGNTTVLFTGADDEVQARWIALRAELPRPLDMRHGYVGFASESYYIQN